MLIRDIRRFLPFLVAGPLLILAFFCLRFYDDTLTLLPWSTFDINEIIPSVPANTKNAIVPQNQDPVSLNTNDEFPIAVDNKFADREVFSISRFDRKYFPINFGKYKAINPNIIPHPSQNDTWIIIAQEPHDPKRPTPWNVELVCNAVFNDGVLECLDPPLILPIAATMGDNCEGGGMLGALALSIGPHDARVFYGPNMPYTIYGSNSGFTCFGMWMEDFRFLVDWGLVYFNNKDGFKAATELQRPGPYLSIEKNWFIFWDSSENMYVHHDVWPKRVFAKLELDGSVGEDLGPLADATDEKCMKKYMPAVVGKQESVHQATNSLSITLCKRSDTSCEVKDSNTFIFTIYQHKTWIGDFNSDYMSYVMMFQRTAPFEIYGMSKIPFWIHGRERAQEEKEGLVYPSEKDGTPNPRKQNEMFYTTSMSWKAHGQKYHGYIDDTLFLAFGIDDKKTGGVDIVVGDLFLDIGLCSEL